MGDLRWKLLVQKREQLLALGSRLTTLKRRLVLMILLVPGLLVQGATAKETTLD